VGPEKTQVEETSTAGPRFLPTPPMGTFNGEFEHKIDSKGRMFVPRRILEEIEEPAERNHFQVVVNKEEGCLDVFTESAYREYLRSALAKQKTARGARLLRRSLGANSRKVPLDTQGRILLPKELRERIELGEDAVLVGSLSYFEIWDRERYQAVALPEADEFYNAEAADFRNPDYEPMEGDS
jgi:MraZ protein